MTGFGHSKFLQSIVVMIFLLQLVFQTLKLVWIIAKKILIILKILMYKFEIKESFDLAY
jgi:hypothetical protein